MNEDPFFSDKSGDEEVLENDRFEEDRFPVPFRYDPLRPAYLQLPLGMAEIPAKTEQLHRQAWMKSKKIKRERRKIKQANQRPVAWVVTIQKPIQTTTICMISIVDQPSKKRVRVCFVIVDCSFATSAFAKLSSW